MIEFNNHSFCFNLYVLVLSCVLLTLCSPLANSQPGSSAREIFQSRILDDDFVSVCVCVCVCVCPCACAQTTRMNRQSTEDF